MGYADVKCATLLLSHLQTTYGRVAAADLATNRASLSEPWNPKDDIENLWCCIKDAQDFATNNQGDPIVGDATAIEATLTAFEKAAVYPDQVVAWLAQSGQHRCHIGYLPRTLHNCGHREQPPSHCSNRRIVPWSSCSRYHHVASSCRYRQQVLSHGLLL
jgi:hypothetical protein